MHNIDHFLLWEDYVCPISLSVNITLLCRQPSDPSDRLCTHVWPIYLSVNIPYPCRQPSDPSDPLCLCRHLAFLPLCECHLSVCADNPVTLLTLSVCEHVWPVSLFLNITCLCRQPSGPSDPLCLYTRLTYFPLCQYHLSVCADNSVTHLTLSVCTHVWPIYLCEYHLSVCADNSVTLLTLPVCAHF